MSTTPTTSASPPAPEGAPAPGGPLDALRWLALDSWTVTRRNLRHFVRQPRLLVFSTIQPVMFVVLFAAVFGGVAGDALPADLDYLDFLLPGLFVQSAAFRATQTAVGLAEDLERGVVDRLRSMPMARSAVLTGRTAADLVRNLVVIGLMTVVGMLLGFRFSQGVLAALGAILIVALFGYTLNWAFTYLALAVPGAEAAQTAGFVVVFPLVFASSIFVPVETMPGWLRTVAEASPLTATADAARALAIGHGPALPPTLLTLAWCAGLLAVLVPISVRRFRRMT
jgi:ABC transporter DrrB family efflux protein